LPSFDAVMDASTARRDQRLDDTRRGRAGAAQRGPPPGMLAMSIQRRGTLIELGLAGDLDMATAPRLREAMAWLRVSSHATTTIVIDTSDVDFIAADGYRALQAALVGPNGLWDPRVTLVVGPAVARLEAAITAASARNRQHAGDRQHAADGPRRRQRATGPAGRSPFGCADGQDRASRPDGQDRATRPDGQDRASGPDGQDRASRTDRRQRADREGRAERQR
jgi:hypothetical protein